MGITMQILFPFSKIFDNLTWDPLWSLQIRSVNFSPGSGAIIFPSHLQFRYIFKYHIYRSINKASTGYKMVRDTNSRNHQTLVISQKILGFEVCSIVLSIYGRNDLPLSPFIMTHIREPTHLSISSNCQISQNHSKIKKRNRSNLVVRVGKS